jgi:hypothetical protein
MSEEVVTFDMRLYFIVKTWIKMALDVGKLLIVFGAVLIIMGLLLSTNVHIPLLGKLPGDIHINRDGFHFYFPLVTSILISVILSLILYFFRR